MDQLIAKLRTKGRVRRHDGQDSVILEEYDDGSAHITHSIPVDQFKARFPNPAALDKADPSLGYEKFRKELKDAGDL